MSRQHPTVLSLPRAAPVVLAVAAWIAAPSSAPAVQRDAREGDVRVLPVRGNIHMIVGAGANITAQIGPDGVLLVDSGSGAKSEQVIAAIRRLTDRPIRWIINTHFHADHVGGNGAIAKAGESLPQISIGAGQLFRDAEASAGIVAHENVLKRMSAAESPGENLPLNTFFLDEEEMFFNGEPVQLIHRANAHTDGDVMVFFRRSDVLATGDLFVTNSYPVIDGAAGGRFDGYLAALNEIVHIAIPEEKQEGGTWIIPGHGRLSDEADVVDVRDMATIIRDRVQALIKAGNTLEQVRAAKPSLDHDDRFRATPEWTPDMFLDAVYRALSGPPAKPAP
jgi:glyoxylase-like metal-dependent hydrolase (beta-lactamase superfamily II)